jgi:hypothetical protein
MPRSARLSCEHEDFKRLTAIETLLTTQSERYLLSVPAPKRLLICISGFTD